MYHPFNYTANPNRFKEQSKAHMCLENLIMTGFFNCSNID